MEVKTRKINQTKLNQIKQEITEINWARLNTLDTNQAYSTFEEILLSIIDR